MSEQQPPPRRIVSLDQFRGYTVVGMLFVNFLGGYVVVPAVFKHHNTYCSYADTIMPQFFFAVGLAYRLDVPAAVDDRRAVARCRAVVDRAFALFLLGFVIYHLDGRVQVWSELQELGLSGFFAQAFRRELFQTLVQIAHDLDLGLARHRRRARDPRRLPDRLGRLCISGFRRGSTSTGLGRSR